MAFSRNSKPSASDSSRQRIRRALISSRRVPSPSRIADSKSAVMLKTTPFSPKAMPCARRSSISLSEWRSGICFTVRRNAMRSPSINAGVSAFSISSRPILARSISPTPSSIKRSRSGFQSTSRRKVRCSLSNVLSNRLFILSVISNFLVPNSRM